MQGFPQELKQNITRHLATMNSHLLSTASWFYLCIKHFLQLKQHLLVQFSMSAASITLQNGIFLRQGVTLGPRQLLSENSLVYYCRVDQCDKDQKIKNNFN